MLDSFTIECEGKAVRVIGPTGELEYTKQTTGFWKPVVGFVRPGRSEPDYFIGVQSGWTQSDTLVYQTDINQPFAVFRRAGLFGASLFLVNPYGEPQITIIRNRDKRPSLADEAGNLVGATGFWARANASTQLQKEDPQAYLNVTLKCGLRYDFYERDRLVGYALFAVGYRAARYVPIAESKYLDRRALIAWTERFLQSLRASQQAASASA